jgi:holo-[acyl-carrier protein] synthase
VFGVIKGIGIDIVELERIEQAMKRQPRFVDRILTSTEQKEWLAFSPKRKVEFLAGRFAAKEAFVKAIGTGISASFSWHDIQVKKESSGKPILIVEGVRDTIHLSVSHSKTYAVAQVIIESSSS